MSSADLLLHPIRLRIIQTFLGDRQLTTSQLRLEIADVAPATLYRQVATWRRRVSSPWWTSGGCAAPWSGPTRCRSPTPSSPLTN